MRLFNGKGAKIQLQTRFSILVAFVVMAAALFYLIWTHVGADTALRSKALAEARTLGVEMAAVWDYIDSQQTAINYNSNGKYDFKGIYCSVAGKAIARRFTMQSNGYTIRYVRDNPRTPTDSPDSFERLALDAIYDGSQEYYDIAAFDSKESFRYVSVLRYKYGCLSCHGDPKGEPDETNYPKEGMAIGDVAGAISIIIPLDAYRSEAVNSLTSSLVFFTLLAGLVVLLVRWALKRWVTLPLQAANLRLRDENEAKSDYLAVMSHELRTPLTGIMAFTDILENKMTNQPPELRNSKDEAHIVSEIRENSRLLLDMINNTIDVEKLEENRFPISLDEIDLVDVIDTTCSLVEPLAQKSNITLNRVYDPEVPIIISDWEALRKITLNLLSNALKFTPPNGEITVGICMAKDSENVELYVRDTGIGISEQDIEYIFGKYNQSIFKTASASQGSGLGLYLVNTLAQKIGGSIRVESTLNVGSTFTLSLPTNNAITTHGASEATE